MTDACKCGYKKYEDAQPAAKEIDMKVKRINDMIQESLAIEAEAAKEAGALAFMARALVQATMPHSKPKEQEFTRTNGAFTMSMIAPAAIGLPYGTIPRLLISWLTTEAVRTKSPVLELGSTLSGFMSDVGIGKATGGRWGSITRLRDHTNRLFSTYITCSYTGLDKESGFEIDSKRNILLVHKADLWWGPRQPDQGLLWKSTVTLNSDFFDEITNNPIPIDMRALKALKKSPMALDIYCWLTYRMSYLRKDTHIPWEVLQMQFGSGYPQTPQGKRHFKQNFLKRLKAVQIVYPLVNLDQTDKALILQPSHTHVPRLLKSTH